MKKTTIFMFSLFSLLLTVNIIFSQEISYGIYNGEEQEYFKKKLKIYYFPERMNDQSYLSDVNYFVTSQNGTIDSVFNVFGFIIGEVTFTSENSDAINLINEFKQSNLFQFVCLRSGVYPVQN